MEKRRWGWGGYRVGSPNDGREKEGAWVEVVGGRVVFRQTPPSLLMCCTYLYIYEKKQRHRLF